MSRFSAEEFTAIYMQHLDGAVGLAVTRVHEREAAEDIVHTVFADLWEKGAVRTNIKSFILTCTANAAVSWRRLHENSRTRRGGELPFPFKPGREPFLDEAVIDKEIRAAIETTLQQMPDTQATVLRLHYLEDQPINGIAAKLGLHREAVKARLFRARKEFRRLYPQEMLAT